MKASIAQKIKELRRSRKLTQQQIAHKLCISQPAYALIESGRNYIAVVHVIRLSKMYGTSTDFILTGLPAEDNHQPGALISHAQNCSQKSSS